MPKGNGRMCLQCCWEMGGGGVIGNVCVVADNVCDTVDNCARGGEVEEGDSEGK